MRFHVVYDILICHYFDIVDILISPFHSIFRMSVPGRPDPPVVGKVTHNSIELYWNPPEQASPRKGDDRPKYCVQEEEVGTRKLSWQAVDSPDKFGISPLMIAAQKGYTEIAQTLLDNKADVHFQNSSGKTALMMACYSDSLSKDDLTKHKREHKKFFITNNSL
ncbi:Fibronectin type 3 and ankyrin repeat domains 1 protein [Exaiptasia diaphana]|nr:Fibronectin type 3 and ankyrin repeat domains 1 protein [Exaiptasia diaphana]